MFATLKFSHLPFDRTRLKEVSFCLVGLGGTGGFAFECLVRSGAYSITVVDRDRFELSNFNRQMLALDDTLDMKKTESAFLRASKISDVSVAVEEDVCDVEADVFVDCTDSIKSHVEVSERARECGAPHVFCAAEEWRGLATVFRERSFCDVFGEREEYGCRKVTCSACAVAGALAAHLALSCALGKKVVEAPDFISFNLSNLFFKVVRIE